METERLRENTMEETNNNQPSGEPAPVAQAQAGENKTTSDVKGLLGQLEALLDEYMIKKAPFQIPATGKELIAKITPYLVILGIIFAIPATILVLIFSPFAILGGGGMAIVGLLFSLAALILEAIALPGLFRRTHAAWHMLFYASIVSILGSLVGFHLVNMVIGAVIGWYILFQVKEVYKN